MLRSNGATAIAAPRACMSQVPPDLLPRASESLALFDEFTAVLNDPDGGEILYRLHAADALVRHAAAFVTLPTLIQSASAARIVRLVSRPRGAPEVRSTDATAGTAEHRGIRIRRVVRSR